GKTQRDQDQRSTAGARYRGGFVVRPEELTQMHWLQDMPIRRKVTLVILLSCTTALVLTCAALIRYEVSASRQAIVRDLRVLAGVLGDNSAAALQFDDQTAAQNILLALRAKPYLTAAALFNKDGERFATYAIPGTQPQFPSGPGPEGYQFTAN